ncbi:hypothetical protein EPUS_01075 [Endocarpon pusillum Z07020]|uniref:Trafficking protein particle complex subunit 6B n=1 Tax=Endocarpon pusillum (strain Z07020 / HMAS-L-300199) TaxID=1263415 RepID=U1HJM1_ENDPU|nr:uncharacterized protein EPUS_01075 [Endocarpon pusillum Z07020]ERF69119.1 hypothetical protein EPUS_01075 [Endocarpon pusillum Z07020]
MSFDAPLPPYTASDSHATFLNVSCLDLLLIEMRGEEPREEDDGGGGVGGTKGDGKKGRVEAKREEVDGGAVLDEEVYRDAIFIRLDGLGYRVGQGLSERFSRDRPRFLDNLDVIKFLCKDLWTILFKKQIDNLKTNHRYLFFPCGIIRGALSSLGINATVQAESTDLPIAVFQIKTLATAAAAKP